MEFSFEPMPCLHPEWSDGADDVRNKDGNDNMILNCCRLHLWAGPRPGTRWQATGPDQHHLSGPGRGLGYVDWIF